MKKYAILTLLIGILFISIGIGFITISDSKNNNANNQNNSDKNANNDNDNEHNKENNYNIIVDTSKIEGDEFDNSNYKDYTINKYVENYIFSQNLSLKNKYKFSYESNLEDAVLGNNAIRAKNNNSSVVSYISKLNDTNIKYQYIVNYRNLGFDKLKTYESTEPIKIEDYDVKYIKLETSKSTPTDKDNYRENFIIIIEENKNEKIVFSYEIIDSKFTDELLTKIINSIDVEKNKATYLYSKVENEKIVGTLKQNSELDSSNIYQITYNLDNNKYQEVENKNNTIDFNTFTAKEKQDVEIYLMTTVYTSNDISTEFADEIKGKISEAKNDIEITAENKTSDIKNEKNYHKLSMTFNNKEGENFYNLSSAYQIESDIYYIISIISKQPISEELLNDFNDITSKKIK